MGYLQGIYKPLNSNHSKKHYHSTVKVGVEHPIRFGRVFRFDVRLFESQHQGFTVFGSEPVYATRVYRPHQIFIHLVLRVLCLIQVRKAEPVINGHSRDNVNNKSLHCPIGRKWVPVIFGGALVGTVAHHSQLFGNVAVYGERIIRSFMLCEENTREGECYQRSPFSIIIWQRYKRVPLVG